MHKSVFLLPLASAFLALSPSAHAGDVITIEVAIPAQFEGKPSTGILRRDRGDHVLRTPAANLVLVAESGKLASAAALREFVAPTAYAPAEFPEGAKMVRREDGSTLLLDSDEPEGGFAFPVTPASPTAFEALQVGWRIQATAKKDNRGLIIVEATVTHTGANTKRAYYGEGTGPVLTKARSALRREVEVTLTENVAKLASTTVTKTPIVLRARPGVSYPVNLMVGDQTVAAKVRCTSAARN